MIAKCQGEKKLKSSKWKLKSVQKVKGMVKMYEYFQGF